MTIGPAFDEVLEAARAGGEWAWAVIYRDIAPQVLGYLRARGASTPEDVAGDAFLQVVRDLPSFEGDEAAFKSWVFTIAYHRLVDTGRYEKRRPMDPVPDEEIVAAGAVGDVEAEALTSLELERVLRILGTLSADQQDVLLLRLLGQLTVEEVAQVVGKRIGAVKALQRRGLASLKRELSRQGVPL
jgi:RNA polymerase sigma-70 factor (ECF subfamily)